MIAENIAKIRENMVRAALAAGRRPEEILLCAATKMNDAARVREAVTAGVDCCGGNIPAQSPTAPPITRATGGMCSGQKAARTW